MRQLDNVLETAKRSQSSIPAEEAVVIKSKTKDKASTKDATPSKPPKKITGIYLHV
jgi:hypothetical protein